MTLTKRIATPRPTAVLLTGGQKAFGLLPLAMIAAEAASASAATAPSCLGVPGTTAVIVPAGTKAPYSFSPSKPVVIDLRAVTIRVNPPYRDGIVINNAPGGTCISGGEVVGQQSRDLGWDDVKHGGAGRDDHDGIHWSHPSPGLVTVENSHIVNVEDAIGPPKGAATDIGASLLVRGVHAEYIRDDFLENDACLPGEVADVLVDGTHMFVSERPSGSAQCVADRPKDLHIHDSVVWLSCQPDMRGSKNKSSCPDPPGGLRQSAGEVFKWRAGSGRVLMERVVVRIDGTPVGGAGSMAWPAGTYQSVTVVWLGPGPYPAPVPPGVTVTTSLALWLNARAAWLQRHQGTGGTSGSGGSGGGSGCDTTTTSSSATVQSSSGGSAGNVGTSASSGQSSAGVVGASVGTGSGDTGSTTVSGCSGDGSTDQSSDTIGTFAGGGSYGSTSGQKGTQASSQGSGSGNASFSLDPRAFRPDTDADADAPPEESDCDTGGTRLLKPDANRADGTRDRKADAPSGGSAEEGLEGDAEQAVAAPAPRAACGQVAGRPPDPAKARPVPLRLPM